VGIEAVVGLVVGLKDSVAPYVIITPAHNEEAFIEETIRSMISQTVRPLRWIVVNDNSLDRTGEIVQRYASENGFIQLVDIKRSGERHFGNKVSAFNRGLSEAQRLDYRFIGNIDADISLPKDYFEKILREFDLDPNLGIVGGMVFSKIGDRFVNQNVALDSVAGAVQLFRRDCFEQIGGYLALPLGGIDAAAEIMARMKRWKVHTCPDLTVFEHRRTGSAKASPLGARVREGRRLYSLGYGLLFFSLRCIYRALEPPKCVGSGAAFLGFLLGLLRRDPIVLPPEVVTFLRTEQRDKLLRNFRSR